MKLLITGGCGFLGSNLASHAIKLGLDVIIFDNLSRNGSTENLKWLKQQGKFVFEHADIRNQNDVNRVTSRYKPDAIFHLCGQVAMTTSISDPRLDFEVNALGTFHLIEAVRTHCPNSAILYSSTNKVYGDLEQFEYEETETRYVCIDRPDGFNEEVQLSFHSPYGCSKGTADQYILDSARIHNLNTVVFRHSSMYGGRQFATYDQGWIGWFCKQAVEVQEGKLKHGLTISGNGKQVRDVLHAEDMVTLYFSALENMDLVRGQAFNIGGGMKNSLSLLELFSTLEEMLSIQINYSQLELRKSDQRVFVADISKAYNTFGWKPQVPAQTGIGKMIEWVHGVDDYVQM